MDQESRSKLLRRLAEESFAFDGTASDPERNCWLVVHRHIHGVLPSEYDNELPMMAAALAYNQVRGSWER